jgi:di/tricarboxylate transporter
MASVGLGGHEWKVWFANFVAHALVALGAWLVLGKKGSRVSSTPAHQAEDTRDPFLPFSPPQLLTLAVVTAWIAAVVLAGAHVGFSAFAAAVLLIVLRASDEGHAVRRMQWGAILMVCGVSVLVAVLEKTGGMDLFTGLIARVVAPWSVNGAMAFLTGVISTYSSTSGVVLPTFLPTVPTLVERVGGGDPLAVALSINVGASLVDVSPLSTIGALCVAAMVDLEASRVLFRQLLVWGLSMTLVGALLCQALAGPLARW